MSGNPNRNRTAERNTTRSRHRSDRTTRQTVTINQPAELSCQPDTREARKNQKQNYHKTTAPFGFYSDSCFEVIDGAPGLNRLAPWAWCGASGRLRGAPRRGCGTPEACP